MKNRNINLLIGIFCITCTVACAQEERVQPIDGKIYEACCGAEPVEFTNKDAYIFVANAFTPNNDGINDLFYPIVNEGVLEVIDFVIYTAEGDTALFDRRTVDYNNIKEYAWNGLRYDGAVYKGAFKYSMRVVLKSGGLLKVEGKACRIVCEPDAVIFKAKLGCFYPVQASTSRRLDISLPNKESGCFR